MKKILGWLVAAFVLVGGVSVFADEGCSGCAKGSAQAKPNDMLAKLNLTTEQKAKLAALKEECAKSACPVEGKAKLTAGLEKILTPEQLAKCKAECEKAGGGCPAMKTAAKGAKS